MKRKLTLIAVVCCGMLLAACEAIFEKNIDDETVTVLAPQNNTVTEVQTIQFWWEEVEGADEYRFQLVRPSFGNAVRLVIDTTVRADIVEFTLAPGYNYQWRVQALNSAHQTDWTVANLTVDSALSCLDQTVLLVSPAENVATPDSMVFFDWEPLACADEYEWQALDASGSTVAGPFIFTTDSATIYVPEGALTWQVTAIEAQTSTLPSSHTLYADRTAPTAPVLNAPLPNDSTSTGNAVTFTWTNESPTVAPITDYFELWADSLQGSPYYQLATDDGTAQRDSLPAGDWFWRVQSEDAAGNTSDWSEVRKFWVN